MPSSIYISSTASSYIHPSSTFISSHSPQSFHSTLPNFSTTPLTSIPSLASSLGLGALFIKNESARLNLPAFKILGASWGTFRTIIARSDGKLDRSSPFQDVADYAQQQSFVLYTATDGNHGRAVARMAAILGIKATIFVPRFTDEETRSKIQSEGAQVTPVDGDYDEAVSRAYEASTAMGGQEGTGRRLFIQDTSFPGYEEIPRWIVEGYSTMLLEIERQLASLEPPPKADVLVTPVGVGSLAHAVVSYAKSNGRDLKVLAVEPERSGCLHASLESGKMVTIKTSTTIMDGMNCGSVSSISWPVLKEGIDASVTISEMESHKAVVELNEEGVPAGPCGAATLAGLRRAAESDNARTVLGLNENSVVVLLCTEGKRGYVVPDM